MVELIEYILAFSLSAGFAGASVAMLSASAPAVNRVTEQSTYSQLLNAASLAIIQDTNKTATVYFTGESISCSNGIFTLSSKYGSFSGGIGASCSFSFSNLSGLHKVLFVPTRSGLELLVN